MYSSLSFRVKGKRGIVCLFISYPSFGNTVQADELFIKKMFVKKKIYYQSRFLLRHLLLLFLIFFISCPIFAQVKDTSAVTLKKITVEKQKKPNTVKNIIPAQTLD